MYKITQLRTKHTPQVTTAWPDMDYAMIWANMLLKKGFAYKLDVPARRY